MKHKNIKQRIAGERFKPIAITRKAKEGIPTVISVNGLDYILAPKNANYELMSQRKKAWKEQEKDAR
jgi:hypothetical protein